jgi:hypothetical protein
MFKIIGCLSLLSRFGNALGSGHFPGRGVGYICFFERDWGEDGAKIDWFPLSNGVVWLSMHCLSSPRVKPI